MNKYGEIANNLAAQVTEIEHLIAETPTGEVRNTLCDANVHVLKASVLLCDLHTEQSIKDYRAV